MKYFLKKYIKKHIDKDTYNKFNLILKVFKNINDKKFVERAISINRNFNGLYFESYGKKNKEKNLFLVNICDKAIGFGAFLRWSIYGIAKAVNLGFIPIIKWGPDCIYKEEKVIFDTENPFEYYFKQIDNINMKELYDSNKVFTADLPFLNIEKEHNIFQKMSGGYEINEEFISYLGNIYNSYIHLNERTENYIKKSINDSFPKDWKKKKILAVHVRGTDFNLYWNNHPNIVQVDDFFSAIEEAFHMGGFDYIFLATDDSNRLEIFKNKYKNKLIYFSDVHRSSGKLNVAFEKNDRENNAYLNGLEVIRDMYTLAYCQGLIAGLSHVSFTARIIKYSLNEEYIYKKIIDKGIYKRIK